MARVVGKEYYFFANICDIVYICFGGICTSIFGIELVKTLKKTSEVSHASSRRMLLSKQKQLARVISRSLWALTLYAFAILCYCIVGSIQTEFTSMNFVADRSFAYWCIFKHMNIYLVYCMLRILEGKCQSNLLLFIVLNHLAYFPYCKCCRYIVCLDNDILDNVNDAKRSVAVAVETKNPIFLALERKEIVLDTSTADGGNADTKS